MKATGIKTITLILFLLVFFIADAGFAETGKIVRGHTDRAGNSDTADSSRAIALDPEEAMTYYNRGVVQHKRQNYRQAIADYDKAIELDPGLAMAYSNRGVAHYNLRDYQQAIADYDKAIALDPNLALAYSNRGAVHDDLGDSRKAIADYDKAITLNPKNAVSYQNRGIAYDNLGRNREAIADYNKAIELDPKNVRSYYNRGVSHHQLRRYKEAIADYDRVIAFNPRDALAYYNRGVAYDDLRDRGQAIADKKMAAALGLREAQEFLKKEGIAWTENLSEAAGLAGLVPESADKSAALPTEETALAGGGKKPVRVFRPKVQTGTTLDAGVQQAVAGLVERWLVSWKTGDMDTYWRCYAEDFKSKNMNLSSWVAHKIDIRSRSRNIDIRIENLRITADDASATASFIQHYSSSIQKDRIFKKLEIKKIDGAWKIIREIS